MPGTKRTTKSISYTEQDDDDDFIPKVDNNKKPTRSNTKTDERQGEAKPSTRQPPKKRNEKLSKTEQEELDLVLKLSKDTAQATEIAISSDDEESSTGQSTVSSNESKPTVEKENSEQDENSLPKSKRMKRGEEEEKEEVDENESNDEEEEEEEEEIDDEDEVDEELLPKKKPSRKTEEKKKNTEIPTVTSIDLNSNRTVTRVQQKPSNQIPEPVKKKSNVPVGFPTSKIIIPSVQASRVGLSRRSGAIKSLHPNLNQRIVHE